MFPLPRISALNHQPGDTHVRNRGTNIAPCCSASVCALLLLVD